MPAFTAAAAFLVAEIGGIVFAAAVGAAGVAFTTSVVAIGLAVVTSRLINGSPDTGGGTAQDPGVRTQLPPATSNKIPVVYGSANTKGVITDARLSSSGGDTNDLMTYVLVLSEQTQSGTFTVGDVYWNDSLLTFGSGADTHVVKSSIDQGGEGTTSTNFADLIKIRVYSGDATNSANQIFPATNKVSAISFLGESDTNYKLSGLVYAVVQIKYSSEKGVTGLADMTFQVENSLKNPGLVWYDYMSSSRYGAGIDLNQIDTVSSINTVTSTSLYSISNEIPENQFNSDQTAAFAGSISWYTGSVAATLTVTSMTSGTIGIGQLVAGASITDSGFKVISQTSGTTGGAGVYVLNKLDYVPLGPFSTLTFAGPFTTSSPSTQVRYQINGVISPGDTVKNNIDRISQNCAAWTSFDYVDGLWKVIPNRPLTSLELADTFEFNDDNILGEVTVNATDLESLYNSLEIEFANRVQRDQVDYFRGAIPTEDRNPLEPDNTLNMRLDLVNNAIHAGRIGQLELLQSRVDLVITFRADHSALQVESGDVVRITNSVYGFDQKPFRVTRTREVETEDGGLVTEITGLEYSADIYADQGLSDYAPTGASGIPADGSSANLPAPSAPTFSALNPTSNTPNFTISTVIGAGSGPVDLVEWWYATSAGGTYKYLTNEHGNFFAGQTVNDVIFGLGEGTWYLKARASSNSRYSDFSSASASFTWAPTPGGVDNGTISTATNSSLVQITSTATNLSYVPLVNANSGFQKIYADSNFTWNGTTKTVNFASTGTRIISEMSSNTVPNSRLGFQTNTTNGATGILALPNGSSTVAAWYAVNNSDATNAGIVGVRIAGNEGQLYANRFGSTAVQPSMGFYTAAVQRMTITSSTGVVSVLTNTNATSTLTGALVVRGGVGIGGNAVVGGTMTLTPLSALPASYTTGTMAMADAVNWNPASPGSTTTPYVAVFTGATWIKLG